MIPTSCIEPGCPNMAIPGPRYSRCASCQRTWNIAREKRPERAIYRDPTYRHTVISLICEIPGCGRKATKDHIQEIHQGGTNDPGNIAALCIKHNLEKSNKERQKRKNRADDQ